MVKMIVNIESPKKKTEKFAFLHLGFRPFFLGASSFAFLAISMWMMIYSLRWQIPLNHFAPMTWHAHEMIFGYTTAVIAGFLLTAVKNWTGTQTLHGYPLLALFLLWVLARLLPFFGDIVPLGMIAITDCLFLFLLIASLSVPLLKAKHWKSLILVSHLLLLFISNIVFYLGAYGILPHGMHYGLYIGFYLILSLILIMGRRVIPFFIEKGVDYPIQLTNWKWIDNSHIIIFWCFVIADLTNYNAYITAVFAGLSCVIHGLRLGGWYTRGIWKNPLLWVLYLAYAFMVIGFALKVLVIVSGLSVFLAVHAFAFGGIGMMTTGMMARVALGHTGRGVLSPPRSLFWIFALLTCGTLIRVFFPLIDSAFYLLWITLSQLLWMLAFAGFVYLYLPILIHPRIDGHYG
jgi:uncharacterized protein involved in response to NO